MVRPLLAAALLWSLCWTDRAQAGELKGPGRFCGYSPIIDLLEGERVVTLDGGIHSGRFRWEGAFGTLEVRGNGWASPPGGLAMKPTARGFARFRATEPDSVGIWDGKHAVAYFSARGGVTAAHLAAIDRVDLFGEGEDPGKCNLRTLFSWD